MEETCEAEWNDLVAFYGAYLEAKAQRERLELDFKDHMKKVEETCGHGPFAYHAGDTPACSAATAAFNIVYILHTEVSELMFNAREGLIKSWHLYEACKHAQLKPPE